MTEVKLTRSEATVSASSAAAAATRPRARTARRMRSRAGPRGRWRPCRRAWSPPRGRRAGAPRSRRGRRPRRHRVVPEDEGQPDEDPGLERAARPEVEEVAEVGAERDDCSAGRRRRDRAGRRPGPRPAPVGEGGRAEAGQPDPEDLEGTGRDLAPREGAEVALEPLARGVAAQVVERAECAGAEHRDDARRAGGQAPQRGTDDEGRALDERHGAPRVVGAVERASPRGAPGRALDERGAGCRDDGRREAGAAHPAAAPGTAG